MLRVISRPSTVPADRIALLNAGLSIILSRNPGSGGAAGSGMGGTSMPVGTGGRSGAGSGGGAQFGGQRFVGRLAVHGLPVRSLQRTGFRSRGNGLRADRVHQ